MNEVLLGKLIDLAFTAAFSKLNRDAIVDEANEKVRNGASLEEMVEWFANLNQTTEDQAQAAIDRM